tara:strand:- start:51 stop:770 length:720 start_codon:yes stop_codon:yes gene_type:complete
MSCLYYLNYIFPCLFYSKKKEVVNKTELIRTATNPVAPSISLKIEKNNLNSPNILPPNFNRNSHQETFFSESDSESDFDSDSNEKSFTKISEDDTKVEKELETGISIDNKIEINNLNKTFSEKENKEVLESKKEEEKEKDELESKKEEDKEKDEMESKKEEEKEEEKEKDEMESKKVVEKHPSNISKSVDNMDSWFSISTNWTRSKSFNNISDDVEINDDELMEKITSITSSSSNSDEE